VSVTKYDQYKDSGVVWLGKVPTHWRVDRLKASIQSCRNGIWGEEALDDENDIPCVRVADFDRRRLRVELSEPTIRNVTEKERVGRVLRKGDLLLEKSGGGENQPVGCVVLYDDSRPAVCSNFVARMVAATGQDSSYWRYVHAAAYSIRLTVGSINQTSGIQNLDQDRYFNEYAVFPPEPEQAAIATFLDRETAKIDALVEEQRRLIELLKEKRQAVITQAVTKGLNSNVPMKDSGIAWLGKVPAHWQPIQLGRVCRQVSDGPHFSPKYVDDGVMFLSARNLSVDSWHLEDAKFVSVADYLEFSKRVVPEIGDVLYTKGGTTGIARVVDLPMRFQVWVHIAVLKLDRAKSDPYFIAYALNSVGCYEQSQLNTRGATNQDLGLTRMIRIWLALPALPEQQEIAEWLSTETRRIDVLIVESESALLLLQERRSALISAAVTGKIDVRGLTSRPEVVIS
jgi:type I restriction enzyme, S subunit